jgi:hypothetical protein
MYKQRSLKYKKPYGQQYCINCGKLNHCYNNCMETLNSYGILCFYKDIIDISTLNEIDKTNYCYKLVMVRRQHTIPYVEFLRGKYDTLDLEYLIILFSRMTKDEITLITKHPDFDILRNDLKLNNNQKRKYKDEYIIAENKFNIVLSLGSLHYIVYVINYLYQETFIIYNKSLNINLLSYESYIQKNKEWIESIRCKICNTGIYTKPEWGIPKGRRQNKESDLKCAVREFSEETGIPTSSIKIYKNVIPLEEIYIGLNGVEYKHTYFIAICDILPKNNIINSTNGNITNGNGNIITSNIRNDDITNRNIIIPIDNYNKEQLLEISKVALLSLPQIKLRIRQYHLQKMNVINKAFYIILQKDIFFE